MTAIPTPVRAALSLVWVALPATVFSAFLHVVDPDTGGVAGLSEHWPSVLVVASPLAALALLALLAKTRGGPGAFLAVATVASLAVAALVTLLGSGASSVPGLLWTLLATTAIVFATLAASVLPVEWRRWKARL